MRGLSCLEISGLVRSVSYVRLDNSAQDLVSLAVDRLVRCLPVPRWFRILRQIRLLRRLKIRLLRQGVLLLLHPVKAEQLLNNN